METQNKIGCGENIQFKLFQRNFIPGSQTRCHEAQNERKKG